MPRGYLRFILSSIRQFSRYNKQNAGNFHYQELLQTVVKKDRVRCLCRRQIADLSLAALYAPLVADNRPDLSVFYPRRRRVYHSYRKTILPITSACHETIFTVVCLWFTVVSFSRAKRTTKRK
jgi:hypothetical protein